jgi:hypothetical protein
VLCDRAHRTKGCPARFYRVDALLEALLNFAVQVVLQLLVKLLLDSSSAEQPAEAKTKMRQSSGHLQAMRTIKEIAVESRSQFSDSLASTFRPSLVIE